MKKVNRLSRNQAISVNTPLTNQSVPADFEVHSEAVKTPNKLIVVLGMHRSGTSAITRALKVLGVQLGDKLIPPMEGVNDKGFWEDVALNTFDMEILQTLGADWQRLTPIQTSDLEQLRNKGYFLRAGEVLSQIIGDETIFGLKDPRLAMLLPFWKTIFKNQSELEVSYVIVIRNPLSVAKSLAKRDGFDFEKSYLLWLGHVLASLINTTGEKRVLVEYDRLMKSPERELKRMASGLNLDIDTSELQIYESEFLDKSLQHSLYKPDDLFLDDSCPPLVREIYLALVDVCSNKTTIEDAALLNQINNWNKEFERLISPLRLMDKLYSKITVTSHSVSELEGQIVGLNHTIAERVEQVNSLNHTIAERDGQIVGLNHTVSVYVGKFIGLNHAILECEEQINRLNQSIDERERQINDLNQAVTEREKELSLVFQSKSWKLTRPLRFIRRILSSRQDLLFRKHFSDISRALWYSLPLSTDFKRKIKDALFSNLPTLLSRTRAYRDWQNFNAPEASRSMQSTALPEAQVLNLPDNSEYVPLFKGWPLENKPVKVICFYLPQFHPIPENNAWWGDGFTEWTNVKPAEPQFSGHYQPHVPGELGYYSLLDSAVQRRQIELAKLYGIEGFCFYFYWFGGKCLLETPIHNFLKDNSLDLPFCLCWANENWSRRWDGLDNEILIAQHYSPDDDLAFIQHVSSYMRDPRYIRIEDKPLLLVYRPNLLPSAKETAERWRKWCRDNDLGEIYLAYTQSFEAVNPAKYGFDAAIEFPPNNSSPPNITDSVTPLEEEFGCIVYDWRVFVERSEKYKRPDYKLFRSVCPSWDNTARRKNRGTVFLNSTPALFQRWLKNAIRDTWQRHLNPDERLVFVNAWNEWAEGAHLEPDARYGYAWLQATRDALIQSESEISCRKIVLVSHDAHPHGAQYLVLNLAKTLSSDLGFKVDLVLLGEGILTPEYSRWATVHNIAGLDARGTEAQELARQLALSGQTTAIVNTTVSGLFLETLEMAGLHCVALVHELSGVIETNNLQEHATQIADKATAIVFPAKQVAESFMNIVPVADEKIIIRTQGLYKKNAFRGANEVARKRLRETLGLKDNAKIVLGVGYADHRKGIDYFVEIGLQVAEINPDVFFVWVGHWDVNMQPLIDQRLAETTFQNRFLFVGLKADTDMYYAGADIYALTSREDPFPSVVMESLEVSVPVVGFKGAGGFDTLLENGCGLLVAKDNTSAFAEIISNLLDKPGDALAMGQKGASIIQESFSFRHYLYDLLDFAGLPLKRVSAIVPNYNYARYLEQRLESIVSQTYPIYELIVLDDSSTDNSVDVIKNCLSRTTIDNRLIKNDKNTGSVFKQWQRGVENAKGDYIWICEADDYADVEFIERSIDFFDDDQLVMTYTQSRQIDEQGRVLSDTYLDYTDDICQQKWRRNYICDGKEELARVLAIKNSIPNVSAVLFRKAALQKTFRQSRDMLSKLKIAGDWLIYANLLQDGKIGHIANSLNSHRRHQASVTTSSSSNAHHLAEIIFMQEYVAKLSDPDEEVKTKASKYVEKIYQQFNLDSAHLHDPYNNELVKMALNVLTVIQ